jgi:hypothetical protein
MEIPEGSEYKRRWKALDRRKRRQLARMAMGFPREGATISSEAPRSTSDPSEAALVAAHAERQLGQSTWKAVVLLGAAVLWLIPIGGALPRWLEASIGLVLLFWAGFILFNRPRWRRSAQIHRAAARQHD